MVKIQFSVKNAFIQKYILFLTVACMVMTFMNMMNRIHYIGASYAIGTILMGITNHIHNSLSITGIGCVLDLLHLIFRSSNSSWTSVRYFQFIIHFLAIVYELMYMTMLHCYWQYTEATKNHSQTSWLKNETILPIKLEQSSAEALNPSISMSQPIQETAPAMDPVAHEPNAAASNSIAETLEPIEVTKTSQVLTEPNVTILEPNVVSEPSAETEPTTATEVTSISVPVSKPTLSSTEPSVGAQNAIAEIQESIETPEPGENAAELSGALTDSITPIQEPNSAALDSIVETHIPIASTEPDERIQEHSVSTPESKEEKQ
ncbi:uncharacterized protein LOC100570742 [Acyrthosiphon pisum]|uniref:Uncharacterized protein n=1 Tax=Acyrthosiphon pisum TaxID=7029 RepID=A0A8R1W9L5_ACYPI|nr:uncharacterized protein LOC100570742 [Acyrthosiphon pisum]|eukprot:XP_003241082.1 PREDICTED: uncharacterized protein LOC100570742 [Acyrthosiphon pisum]